MRYVHCVYFTCKPDTPAAAIDAQIVDAGELLGKIPTVQLVRSGRRDEAMQREVSDREFHIGLVVICDNKADYEVYAEHPLHMDYIARHKANWAKIRVFDHEC